MTQKPQIFEADAIATWVFDLDHTLYGPQLRLFDQIEALMNDYIVTLLRCSAQDAAMLRQVYWRRYGTTLAGLMAHHQIDPHDYLAKVHDIDVSMMMPDPVQRAAISCLPGRKVIYTNGSQGHAVKILTQLNILDLFDAIYGIEAADFVPKPEARAFARIFAQEGLVPARAAMFEDDPRNLRVPAALGMATVLVHHEAQAPYIHHQTMDLTQFLRDLTQRSALHAHSPLPKDDLAQ